MITQEQQKQGAELLNTLAQKAWESSTFKNQLIENPIPTIESVTGHKMQPGINVIVEDQTDNSKIYLNIPRKIELDELELTDEQLETVAGGTDLVAGVVIGGLLVFAAYQAGELSR
ncbi:MAG: NHLP leader peptide family natural product precursor [Sphingobacteriaceae bacterium]|nr:MAG: NHLP leader peptide family natural product precursor [Sphingobacteriaceae bacterium]